MTLPVDPKFEVFIDMLVNFNEFFTFCKKYFMHM